MKLKFLATGTGRCGTVFTARLLTSVGIPCGHEAIFDHKGKEWIIGRLRGDVPLEWSYISRNRRVEDKWYSLKRWWPDTLEAESSLFAAPYLADSFTSGVPLIHLIRNPIKVVNSFCHYMDNCFEINTPRNDLEIFIYNAVPELEEKMPQYDRACLFYVQWNKMIEASHPAFSHRIEDDPKLLLEFVGCAGVAEYFQDRKANHLVRTTNNRFTLDQIQSRSICNDFIEMGRRYGYAMGPSF